MTAPHILTSGTSRPLIVVGGEVTGTPPKGTNLFVVQTTTHRKGKPVTVLSGFEGSMSKNLRGIELKYGETVRICRADMAGLHL